MHTLEWKLDATNDVWLGGIKSTEEVTFELVFTSGEDPQVNVQGDYNGLAYDAGLCTISQSSSASDTRFWDMEASDAYYTCTNPYCDEDPEEGSTETQQDWEAYVTDDDPYNPMCVPFEEDSPNDVSTHFH